MTNKELEKRIEQQNDRQDKLDKLYQKLDKNLIDLCRSIDKLADQVEKLKQEPQHYDFKVGDRVRFNTPKTKYGKIIEIVVDIAVVQDDDGEKYSIKVEDLHSATDEPKCKFKVGDKVKVKGFNEIATVCEIEPDDEPIYYNVKFDDKDLGTTWIEESILEPCTEPQWAFTDDEKVILRNLPDEFKWIARDSDDYLAIFTTKPRKDCEYSQIIIAIFAIFTRFC